LKIPFVLSEVHAVEPDVAIIVDAMKSEPCTGESLETIDVEGSPKPTNATVVIEPDAVPVRRNGQWTPGPMG
jgi:hypothetical protein